MKYILISLILILSINNAKEVTETFNIKGMMCGMSCPSKVVDASNQIKGIKSCEVSYENNNAIITFDDEIVEAENIAKKIAKETYYKVEISKNTKSFWQKLFGKD